jgi:hypothetical protein
VHGCAPSSSSESSLELSELSLPLDESDDDAAWTAVSALPAPPPPPACCSPVVLSHFATDLNSKAT